MDHPLWVETLISTSTSTCATWPARPGDDHQLAEQVTRIAARHLDRARPLWELYLIEGLADGHVAIQIKIHHAAIDGVSGAELPGAPARHRSRRAPRPAPGHAVAGGRVPSERERFRARCALPHPPAMKLLKFEADVARELQRPGALGLRSDVTCSVSRPGPSPPRRPALRRRGGPALARRALRSGAAPRRGHRSTVKSAPPPLGVRHAVARRREGGEERGRVTVNDVVMAICAGALRRWLIDHEELPAEPLLAMVPVSVRTRPSAARSATRSRP